MTKNSFNLKQLIEEQVTLVLKEQASNPIDEPSKEMLMNHSAWLRAMQLWFHGAHHVVSGPGFAGDHVELYGKIYLGIQEEIDGAIERTVGLTGDKGMACPTCLTEKALAIIKQFPSPKDLSPDATARVGLQMEKQYLKVTEDLFKHLELNSMLSLGLNDQLAASASAHETNVYLLQQRTKKNFEEY